MIYDETTSDPEGDDLLLNVLIIVVRMLEKVRINGCEETMIIFNLVGTAAIAMMFFRAQYKIGRASISDTACKNHSIQGFCFGSEIGQISKASFVFNTNLCTYQFEQGLMYCSCGGKKIEFIKKAHL